MISKHYKKAERHAVFILRKMLCVSNCFYAFITFTFSELITDLIDLSSFLVTVLDNHIAGGIGI